MTNPVGPVDTTSLASGKYTSTNILNRIFDLILEMLGSLQRTATSQAERLNFMTQWQKAYTDVMNQIKVFTKEDNTVSTALKDNDTNRGDLNRLNSQYTETLRNKRSIVSDDSKALQSNVNQSNDAVNQQSSLGSSILQELGTILSSIYR